MQIFTLVEVSEKLKVSQDTIIRAVNKGDMSGCKIGKLWRFTEDQIEDYLTKRTVTRIKRKTLTLR